MEPIANYYFPQANSSGVGEVSANDWLTPPDRYPWKTALSAEVGFTPTTGGRLRKGGGYLGGRPHIAFHPLSHWRMEMVLDENSEGNARISAWGDYISFNWDDNKRITISGNGINKTIEAGQGILAIQMLVRGKEWSVIVNGSMLGSGEMPYQPGTAPLSTPYPGSSNCASATSAKKATAYQPAFRGNKPNPRQPNRLPLLGSGHEKDPG